MDKDKDNKVFKIYTKKIAIYLRNKGFKIINTEPNYKKPQFDVYIFEETPEIRKELSDITARLKKEAR